MDSVQDMRADPYDGPYDGPYLTESGQKNQINPVQYERLPVVEGHEGSSDLQDAVNVESPHATHTCSIDPLEALLHTEPPIQVGLIYPVQVPASASSAALSAADRAGADGLPLQNRYRILLAAATKAAGALDALAEGLGRLKLAATEADARALCVALLRDTADDWLAEAAALGLPAAYLGIPGPVPAGRFGGAATTGTFERRMGRQLAALETLGGLARRAEGLRAGRATVEAEAGLQAWLGRAVALVGEARFWMGDFIYPDLTEYERIPVAEGHDGSSSKLPHPVRT